MRTLTELQHSEDLCWQRSHAHRWGVVLAGGDGTRMLPLTRRITGDERPKQFCRILGNDTLLRQTCRRVSAIVPPTQILLVLTKAHEPYYGDEVGGYPGRSLLIQPQNRGTAAAILYSLARLESFDPDAVVAFFPSDHYVFPEETLARHLETAFAEARMRSRRIILLGLAPDAPETGYGWIQTAGPLAGAAPGSILRVRRFWEKPSRPLADALMKLGCLWNSFIMVGRRSAFVNLIRRAAPLLFGSFYPLAARPAAPDAESLERLYLGIPTVNFSQEILSAHPAALAVLRAENLEWSDLGDPSRVLSIMKRKAMQRECGLAFTAASSWAAVAQ